VVAQETVTQVDIEAAAVVAVALQLIIVLHTAPVAEVEQAHAASAAMLTVAHMAKAVVNVDTAELDTVLQAAQDKAARADLVVIQANHIQTHMAEVTIVAAFSAAAQVAAAHRLAAAGVDLALLELFGVKVEAGLVLTHITYKRIEELYNEFTKRKLRTN
jgi:aromatic ring hydroxylase